MMTDLASIIAAAADDTEAQRAAVRAELEALMEVRAPNAYTATTAEDIFAALEAQHYSEGW